jgi:hypothetical protein
VPVDGERPLLKEWHKKINSSDDEIRVLGQLYSDATDTSVLSQLAPAIDIDIQNPRPPKRSRSSPATGSRSGGGCRA